MKLAIIGLSNSGKTTVFNALTRQDIETTIYPSVSDEPRFGVVRVPDFRVSKLTEIYKPKKVTHATVQYIDHMSITKNNMDQNRKVFDLIKDVDAIVHVVRAFRDDSVFHPINGVNPMRDVEILELELIFGDLEFVEKRLDTIENALKKGKKPDEKEKKLLLKCKDALENETPLRSINFDEEEQITMRSLQFISIKPEVVVLNINEKDLNSDRASNLQGDIQKYFEGKQVSQTTKIVLLCGKTEMEIAELMPDEARLFLDELGIQEPVLNKLIHVSYDLLNLISFLTVGKKDVKAWTIKKGATAQKAAGKIHSDIERGFIRAEVISYENFVECGSMTAARDKKLMRLEGKAYEVKDGDIINFRFNV